MASFTISPPKKRQPRPSLAREEKPVRVEANHKPAAKQTTQNSSKWDVVLDPPKRQVSAKFQAAHAEPDPFASYLQPEAQITQKPQVEARVEKLETTSVTYSMPAPTSVEDLRMSLAPSSNPVALTAISASNMNDEAMERIGRLESEKDILSQKLVSTPYSRACKRVYSRAS